MTASAWVPGTIHHGGSAIRVWVDRNVFDKGHGPIAPWEHVKDGAVTAEAVISCLIGESASFAHVYDGQVVQRGKRLGEFADLFIADEVPQ